MATDYLYSSLVFIGAIFLLVSIIHARATRINVPDSLNAKWLVIIYLISFFLTGYISFIIVLLSRLMFPLELLSSGIFLGGAIFVFLVIKLSHRSILIISEQEKDLRDINEKLTIVNEQVMAELTERSRIEESLNQANTFIRTALNSMSDSICIINTEDRKIVGANTLFLREFNLKEEEAIGKTCFEVTHHRSDLCAAPDDVCPLHETITTGDHAVAEHVHYTHDADRVHVEVTTSPIKDADGKISQVVHVARNITEQKNAEHKIQTYAAKLEKINRELQDFVFVASHHLQEPLRKILAFGFLLATTATDSLNDESIKCVDKMQQASNRMRCLINDFLAFSRITSRTQPFISVDLGKIVRQIITKLDPRIRDLEASVEIGDLPAIHADPVQIHHLLHNLIDNALKFHNPDTRPWVKISVQAEDKHGTNNGLPADKLCKIVVEDNGIGFEENHTERIFRVFEKLHAHDRYEGTGIGLAVCEKIVEHHNGSIAAKSTPGKGASFIITLPIVKD